MRRAWAGQTFAWLVVTLAFAAPALADQHQVRVPLHNGKLHPADLANAAAGHMRLPHFDVGGGDIDVSGLGAALFVRGLNAALGDGCHVSVEPGALVVSIDTAKLPARVDDAKRSVRVFTATVAPDATSRQVRHWGLFLPRVVDSRRPLVVLVHGLDAEKESMGCLGKLLEAGGYQVSYFSYPDDQPIEESASLFAAHMTAVHENFPTLKINVIAHSMGGLVARDYIEGAAYAGGVDRLILIGTPNGGSSWAKYRILLEAQQQFHEWRTDPEWNWTWAVTDGLGEAGRDLKPNSKFLTQLNALPRRDGVRYTIIAGSQSPVARVSASVADSAAHCLPQKMQQWWGVARCEQALASSAENLRKGGSADGPVTIASVKLDGVTDMVIVPSDHETLICPEHGNPPGAWQPIQERLAEVK